MLEIRQVTDLEESMLLEMVKTSNGNISLYLGMFYINILVNKEKVHTFLFDKKSNQVHEFIALNAIYECFKRNGADGLLDTCDIEDVLHIQMAGKDPREDKTIFMGSRRERLELKDDK